MGYLEEPPISVFIIVIPVFVVVGRTYLNIKLKICGGHRCQSDGFDDFAFG